MLRDCGLKPPFVLPKGCVLFPKHRLNIYAPCRFRSVALAQRLGDLYGGCGLLHEQVVDADFEHIPARNIRQVHQPTRFVLGQETGVPAVQRPRLIELFVIRHYGVKPPHEVIPKQRQELLIDGFFSVMDARGQDILGVDILRGISRWAVAVFGDTHYLTRYTEVLQHRIAYGNPALNKAQLADILAAEGLHIDIPSNGCGLMAVLNATVPLVPPGHKGIPLVLWSVRHEKQQRWRPVVIEEAFLELCRKLVDFNFIRDALSYTQPAHERV